MKNLKQLLMRKKSMSNIKGRDELSKNSTDIRENSKNAQI